MSKKKTAFEVKNKKKTVASNPRGKAEGASASTGPEKTGFFRDRGVRETIESIVVAVMLALLFRSFEAEAFVIPTGSMAPTLMGRHLDTECAMCGYQYATGASAENSPGNGMLFETTCPICRYEQPHDRTINSRFKSNEDSFNGDRILVSKFAYDIAEPERWDVIVFKYPGNAKQNYIKRLVGLPNETLKLVNGDVYTRPEGETGEFSIARKSPDKLTRMLQLVDDTDYIADELVQAGWPSRWNQWNETDPATRTWKVAETNDRFTASGDSNPSWLSYRHLLPKPHEWRKVQLGSLPDRIKESKGELVTDYYAYNHGQASSGPGSRRPVGYEEAKQGTYWVGDLAIEANVDIQNETGSLGLDLVEGGVHFKCWIDVATGIATITTSDSSIQFGDDAASDRATAETGLKGAGKYSLRFANVDNQLSLWVNESLVEFEQPLVYSRDDVVLPRWSETDAGDAQPVAIGTNGVDLEVTRLRVLRDIYYVAHLHGTFESPQYPSRIGANVAKQLRNIIERPELWDGEDVKDLIRKSQTGKGLDYSLSDDQLMPLGDNSPESSDARAWSTHYVDRSMLTGKALFVYWPHAWRPFWPNFRRMGFIK